jgi:hypothetical protein
MQKESQIGNKQYITPKIQGNPLISTQKLPKPKGRGKRLRTK